MSDTFRGQAFLKLRAALGEPEVSRVAAGELYRWTLARPYGVSLFVTMDSPEHQHVAHIMLSDGPRYQVKPVESFLIYTHDEVDRVIERILSQWRRQIP